MYNQATDDCIKRTELNENSSHFVNINVHEEHSSLRQEKSSPLISLDNQRNLFHGPSSLLSEQIRNQFTQFAGDRFIPCRPSDQHNEGVEKFRHQQNEMLQIPSRSKRDLSDNLSNNGESETMSQASGDSSVSNSDNSQHSSSDSQNSKRVKEQQQSTYNRLLHDQFYATSQTEELSNLTVSQSSGLQFLSQTTQKVEQQQLDTKQRNILKFKLQSGSKMLTTVNHDSWENMQENTAPHNLVNLYKDHEVLNDAKSLKTRRVSKVPFKVLDAPQLQDDFYLNLVDWSSTNVLAVGLLDAVYIWSASTN